MVLITGGQGGGGTGPSPWNVGIITQRPNGSVPLTTKYARYSVAPSAYPIGSLEQDPIRVIVSENALRLAVAETLLQICKLGRKCIQVKFR